MPASRSDPFLGVPGKAMKNPRVFFDVVAGRSVKNMMLWINTYIVEGKISRTHENMCFF